MTTTLAAPRVDKPAEPRTEKPAAAQANKPGRRRTIDYPTGDGKPMAEDALHRDLINYAIPALLRYFANRADVYVSGNDFIYYEEGNLKACVSPDGYVVIGVPKRRRRFYKVWEEGNVAPAVVLEFTSKKTRKDDVKVKGPLYEQVLHVAEYFRFDPSGDYLHPRLQGQRLREGRYEAIELRDNRMHSEQMGLDLVVEGETLRFYDPVRGKWLLTYDETDDQRLEQAQLAESEKQRADSEAERAESEARRADSADQRAESEKQRAESEKQRAEVAEAELARLRATLEAQNQQK